jgi:hypothetical protein
MQHQPLDDDECRFFHFVRLVTQYIPPVLRQLFVLRWDERRPDDKWDDTDGARREACGKKLLDGVVDVIEAIIMIEEDSDPPINLYRYAKKGVAVVVVQKDDSSVLPPGSTVDAIEPDEQGVHGRQLVVVAPSVPNPLPQKCGGLEVYVNLSLKALLCVPCPESMPHGISHACRQLSRRHLSVTEERTLGTARVSRVLAWLALFHAGGARFTVPSSASRVGVRGGAAARPVPSVHHAAPVLLGRSRRRGRDHRQRRSRPLRRSPA